MIADDTGRRLDTLSGDDGCALGDPATARQTVIGAVTGAVEVVMAPRAAGFVVSHAGGYVEIDFILAVGSVRARLTFVGVPLPDGAHLRLPALGGHLDVSFVRLNAQVLISTRALSAIVDGACLEFEWEGELHRLILRHAVPPVAG